MLNESNVSISVFPGLGGLLDQSEAARILPQSKTGDQKGERDPFVSSFETVLEQTIEPVLERAKALIESRGHKVIIEREHDGWDHCRNVAIEPSVRMRVLLGVAPNAPSPGASRTTPYIAFSANRSLKRVCSHESTISPAYGGHSGPRANFALDAITPELVEAEIVSWFTSVMKDARVF